MDIAEYRAGRLEKGAGFSYFVPEPINRQWTWKDPQLSTLLEKACISLGELNSFARLVPNIDLFIQLHVVKEAVVSSRIEGTRTNIDEALMPKDEVSPERRNDWLEVNNYSSAMNRTINDLNQLPLSSRLLCKAHEILLTGVRGEHKMPGQFRTSHNWIGGANLSEAAFIPPAHTYLNELMSDLESFLHNQNIHVPTLARIGIAHYQFETIHPFLDGNGRVGRLMITLYLVSKKILNQPLLYLSAFFEKNRNLYYDNLTRVREKNDLTHWLKYFLVGLDETAKQASATLSEILKLKEQLENKLRISAKRRTHSALTLLLHMFKVPIVSVKDVANVCDLTTKSANDLVSLFMTQGILKEISGKQRNRLFLFSPYLDLFK
ncbi:MAG: Fic family protein [Dissulfurispiraceae bacterium]|jgi:Fic family protein|nr:Fic family protein [Dissulfurispiraceae bacterium]